jgi:hypothetical protein
VTSSLVVRIVVDDSCIFLVLDENRGLRNRCAGAAAIEMTGYAYLLMTESGVRFAAGYK